MRPRLDPPDQLGGGAVELLLRQADVALARLGGDVSAQDKAFYEGKVAAAQFFAQTNLPRISAERAMR